MIRTGLLSTAARILAALLFALIALQLLPATEAVAQPRTDQEARNLATVQAGFDAWRDGTGSPYDALADDASWEITGNSVAARTYTSKKTSWPT